MSIKEIIKSKIKEYEQSYETARQQKALYSTAFLEGAKHSLEDILYELQK